MLELINDQWNISLLVVIFIVYLAQYCFDDKLKNTTVFIDYPCWLEK